MPFVSSLRPIYVIYEGTIRWTCNRNKLHKKKKDNIFQKKKHVCCLERIYSCNKYSIIWIPCFQGCTAILWYVTFKSCDIRFEHESSNLIYTSEEKTSKGIYKQRQLSPTHFLFSFFFSYYICIPLVAIIMWIRKS